MKIEDFLHNTRESQPGRVVHEWKSTSTDSWSMSTGYVEIDVLDYLQKAVTHHFKAEGGQKVEVMFGDTWVVVTIRVIEGDVVKRIWVVKSERVLNVRDRKA